MQSVASLNPTLPPYAFGCQWPWDAVPEQSWLLKLLRTPPFRKSTTTRRDNYLFFKMIYHCHMALHNTSPYCWDYLPSFLPLTDFAAVELLICFGYHQLNCSKWAGRRGRSWQKGHDIVVKALAFEIRLLGMSAVDSDFTMKNDYAHPTSQK